MGAIYNDSGALSFLAPAPSFQFFDYAIQGQLVDFEIFDSLGGGFYEYKKLSIELHAPGWVDGYGDDDVAKCTVNARNIRYQFAGVRW